MVFPVFMDSLGLSPDATRQGFAFVFIGEYLFDLEVFGLWKAEMVGPSDPTHAGFLPIS